MKTYILPTVFPFSTTLPHSAVSDSIYLVSVPLHPGSIASYVGTMYDTPVNQACQGGLAQIPIPRLFKLKRVQGTGAASHHIPFKVRLELCGTACVVPIYAFVNVPQMPSGLYATNVIYKTLQYNGHPTLPSICRIPVISKSSAQSSLIRLSLTTSGYEA